MPLITRGEVHDWLAKNGIQVGEDAANGNEKALKIMKFYKMWFDCPNDPGAEALTLVAIREYAEGAKND